MSELESVLTMLAERLPALRPAIEAFTGPPWRIAVIGRRSVGKSSLVNQLTGGTTCATGLGGITQQIQEVGQTVVYVDTPPIEAEAEALALLQPLLEDVDGVIWLVDGLQPLTRTERHIVEMSLVPSTPLLVGISRIDLVPDTDKPSVVARVTTLTAPFQPLQVVCLDPRRDTPAPPLGLSPRRRAAFLAALEAASAEHPPCPPDPEALHQALRARWRKVVRSTEAEVSELMDAGRLGTRGAALERLQRVAARQRTQLLDELEEDVSLYREHGLPELPTFETEERPVWQQLLGSFGGVATAKRTLKAAAGAWLQEGELALADYVDRVRAHDRPELREEILLLRAVIHAVEAP